MPGFDGYVTAVQWAGLVTAVLIAISSVDDLFVDAVYWLRRAYRRVAVTPRHERLPLQALYDRAEQPIAIMIPAWREEDVIASMVENAVSTLDYRTYVIFIGTYPNDPDTIAEVERLRRRYRRIIRVDVGHAGPTCKADCLNAVVRAIFDHEKSVGFKFQGIVLHDSEDVLHPAELKFFNYLLPRKDLIQLPVVSLERRYRDLIAGTYMDEFAEWHAKDLLVREVLAKAVPSAGVGTCFSRRAMKTLIADNANEPFNTQSLTEDYDIGARLSAHGLSSIIAHYPVEFKARRRTWFGLGQEKIVDIEMPLCVREYFPNTFRTSYRQKARWALGISLQGWAQLGWTRSLRTNYFLARDRKSIFTPTLTILAYVIVLNFLVVSAVRHYLNLPPVALLPESGWISLLLLFNLFALSARVLQRLYFVGRLYGWEHGLVSLPRMVVGSAVNFAATVRATGIYVKSLVTGGTIAWDKTTHEFPSAAWLAQERRQLGEILTSWEAITPDGLGRALAEQAVTGQALGRILLAQGGIDDDILAEAIAVQNDLSRTAITIDALRMHSARLPVALSVKFRALAVGVSPDEHLILAVARPLSSRELEDVTAHCRAPVVQRIAPESDIIAGLRLLAGSDLSFEMPNTVPLLGDILIQRNLIRKEALEAVLVEYDPARDGRIGELLVRRGVVVQAALDDAIAAQADLLKGQMHHAA